MEEAPVEVVVVAVELDVVGAPVVAVVAVVAAVLGVAALADELPEEVVEEEPPEEPPHAASPRQASEISSAVGVCMRQLKPIWRMELLCRYYLGLAVIIHRANRIRAYSCPSLPLPPCRLVSLPARCLRPRE